MKTTVSKLPSSNGSCSAPASTSSTSDFAAASLGRSCLVMCGSGSAITSSVRPSGKSPRLAPVPAPTSIVRPLAWASTSRRLSRIPASSVPFRARS